MTTAAEPRLDRQRNRDRGPAARLLGHRLLAVEPETAAVELAYEARADFFNPMGVMQGGFTAAMLDQALVDAVVARADMRQAVTVLETQCCFLRAIGPGELRCRAEVVHLGRSTAFAEARLYGPDGALAATATAVTALGPREGAD
ncbi:MAG: PaaI family thioesterase [Alphaproteobacteria bacterium]|jgi:uncharacterized protein (TIGR00369 family)|nr:PaaI family thioesterase [Alphaproteobacteria bacterium]MDP6563736.1 PaaI family thioesterase [Alphaproteobacteria bacterium]MDP6814375.1 PaaI family thioesterase [Alphaproteobacteria bacterium]